MSQFNLRFLSVHVHRNYLVLSLSLAVILLYYHCRSITRFLKVKSFICRYAASKIVLYPNWLQSPHSGVQRVVRSLEKLYSNFTFSHHIILPLHNYMLSTYWLKFCIVRKILNTKRYITNPFRGRGLTPVLSIWYSIIEFMRNFRIFKQVHRKRNYRDRSYRIYLDIIEYFEPNHITIHRTTTGVHPKYSLI